MHSACLVWAGLADRVIIAYRVSDPVSRRCWALLLECGCLETVVSPLERVASVGTNRASQRLANLFHISVAESYGVRCRMAGSYRTSLVALVESRLTLVQDLGVFQN